MILKNRTKRNVLLSLPLAAVIFALVAFKSVDFNTSKSLDIFFSFFRELSIFYVDEVDPEQLIYIGIDAMLESLDPYNEFIPEENADAFDFQTTGEYGGMGALIRQGKDYPIVAEVYEDSPAHKAGIMAGDIIQRIDNNSVKGLPVEKVSKRLKGVPNTDLQIVVKRFGEDELIEFNFKREQIHIPSVPYYGIVSDGVGYIRLANFTSNCDKEVENALKDLLSNQGAKRIILDVRGNPGGLLYEAVKIVNLFVEKNKLVVYTQGQIKEFDQEYRTPSKPVHTEVPLVVLVDRVSASASEIVAGALQDLDRAVIIGERTFGKGLVQATRPLPYNSQVKITTAKYYIPSGRCIQAFDFTQRKEDGSIGYIPDSLISEFNTMNGRLVYDGGGIEPDIDHRVSIYSRVASVLYARNTLFDFATRYRASKDHIEEPANFRLTDKEYDRFIAFLDTVEFEYKSETHQILDELITAAKQENYYEIAHHLIDSLESVINENRQKDLYFFRDEISRLLEEEIVGRYYLQQGKAEYRINIDEVIPLSIDILKNAQRYNEILSVGNRSVSNKTETPFNAGAQPIQRKLKSSDKLTKRHLILPS